jgi:hexosaminidase
LWSPVTVSDSGDLYPRLWGVSDELEKAGATQRTGPAAILSSIAGALEPALADVVETLAPLPLSTRLGSYPYTTSTPFNRVVDAAVADPRAMRDFAAAAAQLADPTAGADARARMRALLAHWKSGADSLLSSGSQEPRLQEVAPLLQRLHDLAAAGLSALDLLDKGAAAPADWRAAQESALAQADQPVAELHSLLAPLVRKLVDTAAAPAP